MATSLEFRARFDQLLRTAWWAQILRPNCSRSCEYCHASATAAAAMPNACRGDLEALDIQPATDQHRPPLVPRLAAATMFSTGTVTSVEDHVGGLGVAQPMWSMSTMLNPREFVGTSTSERLP